jgi:hypothetical protein
MSSGENMGYRWIFITLGFALITGCNSNTIDDDLTHDNPSSITGRYVYIGNPCTTDPCLPGMAYALQVKDKYYYITIDNHWFSEKRSWDEYTPEVNDFVTATGHIKERKDVFNKPFFTIEVISLHLAK